MGVPAVHGSLMVRLGFGEDFYMVFDRSQKQELEELREAFRIGALARTREEQETSPLEDYEFMHGDKDHPNLLGKCGRNEHNGPSSPGGARILGLAGSEK
ncbi:hypothetical protein LTR86_011189 [Recurvomyces mirabilis]|nr:hypothetical protein LTR86_011189 [Recurvomyces mirabilis]